MIGFLIALSIGGVVYWDVAWGKGAAQDHQGAFLLRSELPINSQVAERMLMELSYLETDIEEVLGLSFQGRRIEGNIFATRQTYLDYVSRKFPGAVDRTALYVGSAEVGRILLYEHSGTFDDLRHECTHAIMHGIVPSIPLWLDEGLAEYFEAPREDRVDSNPYLAELKELCSTGWTPDLRRLEQKVQLSELTADDYRECWAWAHFFIHGPPSSKKVFDEFLIQSQSGRSTGRLSELLNSQLAQFEADLISHLKDW